MKIEIADLPRDPEEACLYVVTWFEEQFSKKQNRVRLTVGFKNAASDNLRILGVAAKNLPYTDDLSRPIANIAESIEDGTVTYARDALTHIKALIQEKRLEAHFSHEAGEEEDASFTLDNEEVEAILTRTSEMRIIISNSDFFDPPHKRRLLGRLSQVEFEVYKKKGRFDSVLGGVVDFGEALGQFGTRVKPLVDRMGEIRKITQAKTGSYDELPAPDETKRLPPPDDEDDNR